MSELESCREHLQAELAAVDPVLVVALGKVPAEHLLDREVAVTSEAGTVHEADLDTVRRVLVCVHPAATLYDRRQAETFEGALATAADYTGDGGQSTFGDF
jgi:DNA polymerase